MAAALGPAVLAGGYVYRLLFADLSRYDPKPGVQTRYDEIHAHVGNGVMLVGLLIGVAGLIGAGILVWRSGISRPMVDDAGNR